MHIFYFILSIYYFIDFGAPSFNYGNDTLIITTDNFINLLPFVKGKIDNYTLVSGDLPNGLSFNTADGSITGEFETIFETMYNYHVNIIFIIIE